ncbi:MAG: KTSC domain-containing protein [Myxococcota bacterium]
MSRSGTSSAIKRYSYEPATRILEVEFPRGAVYDYFDVPASVYEWLEVVPNKERYVNGIIAQNYRFEHVNDGRPRATENIKEALELSIAIANGIPIR